MNKYVSFEPQYLLAMHCKGKLQAITCFSLKPSLLFSTIPQKGQGSSKYSNQTTSNFHTSKLTQYTLNLDTYFKWWPRAISAIGSETYDQKWVVLINSVSAVPSHSHSVHGKSCGFKIFLKTFKVLGTVPLLLLEPKPPHTNAFCVNTCAHNSLYSFSTLVSKKSLNNIGLCHLQA